MAKRFQFRHVNELTGLFVLLILIGAAAAILVAARSQHWFAPTIEFKILLPPTGASGLKPGDEVVVLGLPAGVVTDVVVDESGRLHAPISVRRDFAQFIREDSQATIKKVFGVAGDSFVELSRGSKGGPLTKGVTIHCQSVEELPSVMNRLLNEVREEVFPVTRKAAALLDEWARLGTNLNASEAHLHEALVRFNRITADLEAGKSTVGRLLTDTNLVSQAERVLNQSQETLEKLQLVLNQVQEGTVHLPEVTENLRQGTAALPAISQAVEAEAGDLPGMVLQLQQTSAEIQRLVEAMQRHWLLRKYVEPQTDGGRIPPGQIGGGAP